MKKVILLSLLSLSLPIFLVVCGPGTARGTQKGIGQLQSEINEVRGDLAKTRVELNRAKGQIKAIENALRFFAPKITTFTTLEGQPEGIAIDKMDNLYAGLALKGEIVKVTPARRVSHFAFVPPPKGLKPNSGFLVGLAFDKAGNLYAALASFVPDYATGVYRIDRNTGAIELFATHPEMMLPNDLIFDESGNLLISDSWSGGDPKAGRMGGTIFKASPDGQTSILIRDPGLSTKKPHIPTMPKMLIGANGMALDEDGNLLVANTGRGEILKVNMEDGKPTGIDVWLLDKRLIGADGIVFDRRGYLYVAVNVQNKLVVISPEREITEIASSYPLEFPASLDFGQLGLFLYVTNMDLVKPEKPFTVSKIFPGIPEH